MPKVKTATPKMLQPFTSHGLDLSWQDGGSQVISECPFCGADAPKFSVEVETSKFKCWSCRESGNAASFLSKFHALCAGRTTEGELQELAEDRGLLSVRTLTAWGVCRSLTLPEHLVPSYNADGVLNNLFRYNHPKWAKKRVLQSTAATNIGMFGVPLLTAEQEELWVVESWNAPVLWEVLGVADDRTTGVVGVSGCNVFQESWCPLFAGKRVVLGFDSDEPKPNRVTGKDTPSAGLEGCRRTAEMLLACPTPPASVSYVCWGPDGYDPDLPDGYDIRDALTESSSTGLRVKALNDLRARVQPVPDDWVVEAIPAAVHHQSSGLTPTLCCDWVTLRDSLRRAIKSRKEIEDVFVVTLAVVASTSQVGDQIFLQLVASPGSAKTVMCDALLVSKNCFPLEDFNSFYSGYKGKGGEDFSLISRINHKTLITPEADVIMSSTSFDVIMSQQRRIFDGSGGKTFGNDCEDTRHSGLRTPWIMAGTPAMLDKNQSRLGDRFIKVVIGDPTTEQKRDILRSVGYTAIRSVMQTSNGDASKSIEESRREFYQLTGGYVDWLRSRMEEKVNGLVIDHDWLVDEVAELAEFAALMRGRPAPARKDGGESHDMKELPSRLTSQFARLACCVAVVLNKLAVDDEVMGVVRKVAVDTGMGRTMNIVRHLHAVDPDAKSGGRGWGRFLHGIARHVVMGDEGCYSLLNFMKKQGTVESFSHEGSNQKRWRLTEMMEKLYKKATGE